MSNTAVTNGATETQSYSFILWLSGVVGLSDEQVNRLYEQGCGDGTVGERAGRIMIDFDRISSSFIAAAASAVQDAERAVPELRAESIEYEDMLTLPEIATRAGRTEAVVHELLTGTHGPGGFPPAHTLGNYRFWEREQVALWFSRALDEVFDPQAPLDAIRLLNEVLALRQTLSNLPESERTALGALL